MQAAIGGDAWPSAAATGRVTGRARRREGPRLVSRGRGRFTLEFFVGVNARVHPAQLVHRPAEMGGC